MTIDSTDIDRHTPPDPVPLERPGDSTADPAEFPDVTVTEVVAG